MEEKERNGKTEDQKVYISPVGALIALICFFLPWAKFSCDHTVTIKSGAQLGDEFWLVFVAALVIIAAFYIFKSQRQIGKSRLIVIVSSIIAVAVMIIKYAALVGKLRNELDMTPEQIGLSIEFGAFGTILGFIVALIGVPFLRSQTLPKTDEQKTASNYCGNCGAKVTADDSFCPNCGIKIG